MNPKNGKQAQNLTLILIVTVAVLAGVILGAIGYHFIFGTSGTSSNAGANSAGLTDGDIMPVSTTSSVIAGVGASSTDSATVLASATSSLSGPSDLPPVSSASASVDTSTWQTYTNYELGFSLQYPPDLIVDTSNPAALVLTFPSSYFTVSGETASVSVEISSACSAVPSQEVDLNGISFAKNQQNGLTTYYSDNNGVCYTLSYQSDGENDATNVDDIANEVLSTFAFISTPAGENEATYSEQQSEAASSTQSSSQSASQSVSQPAQQSAGTGIVNLSSVSPGTISVGGNLVLSGSGFSGSNTIVWISNGSVQGILWEGMPSSDTSINATIPAQACTQDEGTTGLQCPSYLILSPGVYTVSLSNQNGMTDPLYIRIQ